MSEILKIFLGEVVDEGSGCEKGEGFEWALLQGFDELFYHC